MQILICIYVNPVLSWKFPSLLTVYLNLMLPVTSDGSPWKIYSSTLPRIVTYAFHEKRRGSFHDLSLPRIELLGKRPQCRISRILFWRIANQVHQKIITLAGDVTKKSLSSVGISTRTMSRSSSLFLTRFLTKDVPPVPNPSPGSRSILELTAFIHC